MAKGAAPSMPGPHQEAVYTVRRGGNTPPKAGRLWLLGWTSRGQAGGGMVSGGLLPLSVVTDRLEQSTEFK